MSLLNEITAESNLFETRTLTVNGNNFNVIIKNSTKSKALLWLPGFNEYFYHYHLNLEKEANKYAKILGYNYNSSEWYAKSYKLLNKDYQIIQKKEKENIEKKDNFIKKIIKMIK